MPDFLLGKDGKMYQGPNGTALGALTEVDVARDVTTNLESGEADVTSRANAGYRGTAAALRDVGIEFEALWKPGDTSFDDIRDAWLAGTTLEFAILDQDRATSGAQGPKATFSIINFTRTEALEDSMKATVTIKLATFTEWVEV